MAFFSVSSNFACAQADSSIKRPSAGGHYFTPVTHSKLPFIDTYFYTLTGVGQTANLIHKIDMIEGLDFRGLKGELTFIDLGFAYQQNVRDWLAAYITIDFSARIGTEMQSILAQGINTTSGFKVGWHIKLVQKEKTALSTFIELYNNQGNIISVLGFAKDIINGNPNPSLSQTIPVLSGASGLRFAYGVNDLFGFKASTDLIYGESFERGINEFSISASGGIDLDFNPRFNIPLGIVFNYTFSTMPSLVFTSDKPAQLIHGKIAFTRAKDFNLGVEYTHQKIPLRNQDKPVTVNSVALAARYYF